MSHRALFVMDPIAHITPQKDTTFALMLAAQAQGLHVAYCGIDALYLQNGQAQALVQACKLNDDTENWYENKGPLMPAPLGEFDFIFMRKDPPFDMDFVHATQILSLAEAQGANLINRPQSLRDCNEKLFTAWFPQCCVDTLVSAQPRLIREFLQQHHDIIVKPLDGMGGQGIFRLRHDDPNIGVVLETLIGPAGQQIMAQRFIPEISQGDKRILMINGKAVSHALARIPAQGETRGNLAAGGRGECVPLSERDHWIAEQVGPELQKRGLHFVGLDVIGDYLTEINVTSPTCAREIERDQGVDITERFIQELLARP